MVLVWKKSPLNLNQSPVCTPHVCLMPTGPEEAIRFWSYSGTRCGCWELSTGPLQKQTKLLTAELSLQIQISHFCGSMWHW